QQVTANQPYEIIILKVSKEKEFDYQQSMKWLLNQQATISVSLNLILQVIQNQIVFYDLKNGQTLAKFNDDHVFTEYMNSFFLSSILNDNKFYILTQFYFCLYSFKYPKRVEQSIIIKRENCIDSLQLGFDISSSINSKFQTALIIDDNAHIFDLNNLKLVITLANLCCTFGYSYSIKHGIYFGGQNIFSFPIQLQFILAQQNKTLNFILVDVTLFQKIIQLSQDFTCYTDSQGWVWFYSFQTQALVHSKRFHASVTTNLIYIEKTFEIFAISQNKIYFGILNLYTGDDIQNYIIISQSNSISDIIVIDNLDLIIATGNNSHYEFYQKSTGSLIKIFDQYQIFYIQSFQSLIYQDNYQGSFKLFDINSLFNSTELYWDRNQNIIPKLYDQKNQMIYAVSRLNQIYQIDIINQEMNNLVKRLNTIISIQQIGCYNIYQTSQEIIFQSVNYKNQEYSIIPIESHLLEIVHLSQEQDKLQNFKLMLITFPQKICFISGSFDNKNLQYSQTLCSSQLQYKISSTKQINKNIILILHTNGMMSIINNNINSSGIFEVLTQQQCHNKKYQIQMLQKYQFSNSTTEIQYFLTYSIDLSLKIFQFVANKENNKFKLKQMYFQQFNNKILQVIITKDQQYSIVAFQNQRIIQKICIFCQINNTTLLYQTFFQLPFSRSKYQIHLYEQYNYLLVFLSQMYLLFDFLMANPLFISTQSYINNMISDIRVVSKSQIVIATQNYVQLLNLDFYYFKYNFFGSTNQLFIQQNQNLKIFFANLYNDSQDMSYYVLNLIGYDIGLNNVVFYKIPIISSNSNYTCLEVFKNPNQITIQKKIDGYQQLQNSLTNQVKNYQFQLEFTINLLNQNQSYIQTAYPITIPHQSNNLKQQLLFTGSHIYLDKIDFFSMQSYYTVIYFNNATIYVKDNVIISSFKQVIFKNCTFYLLLPDVQQQPYIISLKQNNYIEFTNITISNQSIPNQFQGFQISQNFDNVIINKLFITNLSLQSLNPIFEISQGNNLTISQIFFQKNIIQSDFSNLVFYLDRINSIKMKNIQIENNQKQLISKQLTQNYFIYVTTSKLQQISNIKFQSNQNCLFYYFPNVQKYQQDNINYQIFFTGSSLIFQDIIYQNNTQNEQNQNPSILFQQASNIFMSNLFIKNNTIKNSVVIQIDSISNVTLINSFFSQNKIQSCIFASNGDQIVLKNTNFTNNKSYGSGAGLTLQNFNQTDSNLIQGCFFSENLSYDEGGAMLLQNVDLDIQNSSFINNTSTIGGAIRYKQIIPSFVRNMKNSRNLQSQKPIIFQGNHAKIFGKNIGSYPSKVVLKQDLTRDLESYIFENYRSGDSTFLLKLVMLDEEQNPVNTSYTDNSYSLKIQNEIKTYQLQLSSLNQTELEIKDNTQFQYVRNGQDYLFNLQGMQLIGTPSKKVKFQIQTFFISTISGNQISVGQRVYSVFVSFRDCQIGEIYVKISDTIYECSPCGDTFYSLQAPIKDSNQACKSCPAKGTKNCINNKIILLKGYWRKNKFSDIIIYCANRPQNCQGNENNGYCVEGYIGPLCEVCDIYGIVWGNKYGSLGNYQCNQCNQPINIIIKQLIHFILFSLYLIYSIQKSIDVASKQIIYQTLRRMNVLITGKTGEKDQISFCIKLFINYVQVTSIIQNSIFNSFSITFIDFSSIFGSPSSYLSNSLDCFFSQTDILPIEYLRGIWVSIQPFFYILITIVLFAVSGTTKLNQQKRRRFFYAAQIFGFITFQCNTATQLVLIMSCSQIGDGYYIKSQLNKECYTTEHLKYTLYIILALFLFWVIIITLLILWRIRIKRNQLTEPIQLYKYGFICGDYKTKYFYWEFLRILLRLSIVLVGNIFAEDLLILKSNFAILMIQIYNYCLIKLSPYTNQNSLKIDYYLNQCISVLFLLNPISYYTQNSMIYLAQFIVNLICYAMFLMMMIGFIVNKNHKLNKYLRKKIPFLNRFLQKPFTNFKRFALWKKVKKHFEKFQRVKKIEHKIKQSSLKYNQNKIVIDINENQYHDNNQNMIDIDFNTPKNSEIAFINLKSSPDFQKSILKMKNSNNFIQSPIHSNRHIIATPYQKSNFQHLKNEAQNKSFLKKNNQEEVEENPKQKTNEDKKKTQSINVISEIASIAQLNLEENTQVNQILNIFNHNQSLVKDV
ncbi:hypothetical protein ABPG72_007205, partial [Tetrahymena utriculariae]